MYFDAKRKLLLHVQGDAFLAWLADCIATNRTERVFAYVQSAVETEGLTERSTGIEPAAFWTATPGAIYLSCGPGSMVRITANKAELVDNGTDGVLFPFGATLALWKFPMLPRDPFESCALFRDMQTAAPHGLELFKLWLCSLPSNQRTKPPLVLSGEVGSGKTRLAKGIFELYGLPLRIVAVLKNGDGDFWAGLDGGGLFCIDNADTRIDWLPDACAAAATAGTLEKRRLYTDAERVSLKARSWLCITSASPTFAADAGLADRLLVVRLNRRKGATAETELSDEILRNRDGSLNWIVDKLRHALADNEPVPPGLNARHPDFASLAVRIGRAIASAKPNSGLDARSSGTLQAEAVAALQAAELDKGLFNLENDNIGATLLELLNSRPFNGTAAELLKELQEIDPALEGKLSVKRLAKRLAKLWPHLQSACRAESEKAHGGFTQYSFQKVAGNFGDFERNSLAKSPRETHDRTLLEMPLESHQIH